MHKRKNGGKLMERKQNGGSFRSGAVKRLLSLMLALALVLSLMPAIGLFDFGVKVSAAATQTIYFKNSITKGPSPTLVT